MKNKRLTVFLILSLLLATLILSACGDFGHDKAVKYATKKYGMDEILCCLYFSKLFGVTVDGEYLGEDAYDSEKEYSMCYNYFLGVKNDEEVALIFPRYNGEKISESQWIFDVSFKEMTAMLNAKAGKDICPLGTDYYLVVLNTLYDKDEMLRLVPEIEQITLDVPLMLLYPYSVDNNYAIVQSDGKLLIFNVATQSDN